MKRMGARVRRPGRPSSWGILSSRTMMVMMTAMTPSEKASRRVVENRFSGMAFGGVSGSEDTSGVDEGLTPIYTDDTDFKDLTCFQGLGMIGRMLLSRLLPAPRLTRC